MSCNAILEKKENYCCVFSKRVLNNSNRVTKLKFSSNIKMLNQKQRDTFAAYLNRFLDYIIIL